MKVEIEATAIAEIRNILQIIMLSGESVRKYSHDKWMAHRIIREVKRIDKLLPQVNFEGGIKRFKVEGIPVQMDKNGKLTAGKSINNEEDCPVCHGQGATTDHHEPCTECGGSGKVGGED